MSKIDKKKAKQRMFAVIGLVLIVAMLVTTFVSALFV